MSDEYGILPSDIAGLSAISKLTYGNACHHNAALAIQKKYRGWKGRKDYFILCKKVVKIHAHVRGHQTRKKICWAVGIVDKVILRWRRKGVGLRGFPLDSIDESSDEDIEKVFGEQRIEVALNEAISRVLSKVNSTHARQQYRLMLQKYQQAKDAVKPPPPFSDFNHGQGNFYIHDGNLSHELFYYIQALRGTHLYSLGQGSSYIHDGNLSHEVRGVSGQAPSIGDMVWDMGGAM